MPDPKKPFRLRNRMKGVHDGPPDVAPVPVPVKVDPQGRVFIAVDQLEPIWLTLLRLEAKLDRMEKALKAGAIGAWGNQ